MKLICTTITLLLFTFSAHAQLKLEITPSDSKYAKMSIECEDQSKCDEKLVKWIDKQRFFKGEWKSEQEGSIVSRVTQNMDGANVTLHFHPANFTVQLRDMTDELAAKEAERVAKKAKRQRIKALSTAKKSNESVAEWRARVSEVLDELLLELREE
jgi:hypothetical protein